MDPGPTDLRGVAAAYEDAEEAFLDDLFELLSTPSISTTGAGIEPCVELAERLCLAYGFDETHRVETDGHPALLARAFVDGDPDNERPTVLIFGHYDVQPVDPEAWTSPPFEPTIRDGPDGSPRIYARGAGDNKGQWFAHLCALRALGEGGPPVNLTLLLEGEEEIGSPHVHDVVRAERARLRADLFYTADGPIDPSGRPVVMLGSRGLLYVELTVRGADRDLHSGNYGGPVPNAAWELVHLLATMQGPDGYVRVDGFYDDVRELTDADRAALRALPDEPATLQEHLGIAAFAPGPGESYHEQLMYQPTMNLAGLTGGYGGEGKKTVLPARATAKLGLRLVPDQEPDDVFAELDAHVRRHAPPTVEVEVEHLGGVPPHRTPLDSPWVGPLERAVAAAWDREPIVRPSIGASGPKHVFADLLDVPVFIIPYANSDEDNHAPDENLALECFRRGVLTTASVLQHVAAA